MHAINFLQRIRTSYGCWLSAVAILLPGCSDSQRATCNDPCEAAAGSGADASGPGDGGGNAGQGGTAAVGAQGGGSGSGAGGSLGGTGGNGGTSGSPGSDAGPDSSGTAGSGGAPPPEGGTNPPITEGWPAGCGDGSCASSETCSTCAIDCAPCGTSVCRAQAANCVSVDDTTLHQMMRGWEATAQAGQETPGFANYENT